MIELFKTSDLKDFQPNEFSKPEDLPAIVGNPGWQKFTYWVNEKVECIICFWEVEPRIFGAFFLISRNFKVLWAKNLKRFIYSKALELKASSIISFGADCEIINKWHEFLGFELVGNKCAEIGNKTFNRWEVSWAGKQ